MKTLSCSFVGNRGLCGKQINVTCKDDAGGPGTNSQSPTSGKVACIGTWLACVMDAILGL